MYLIIGLIPGSAGNTAVGVGVKGLPQGSYVAQDVNDDTFCNVLCL